MNVIRLAWATEMIDDIYTTGHDIDLKASFVKALGEANGTKVYHQVLAHNPHFNSATTRLQASSWPNFVSLSLYNELRETPAPGYGWQEWYEYMIPAAEAVNTVNPDALILLVRDYKFADKLGFELHNYEFDQTFSTCAELEADLNADGFSAVNISDSSVQNRLPVVLTEFGFAPETYLQLYSQCIKDFVTSNHIRWTMWDVSGSYYTRQGIQNYDETWGK
ncbi:glycoside hydrolase [Penicillium lagena]|uniref:glycoside hydrolase n=1 Tax=Penicillium lagena TaxID=94218 RepID=UPI0025401F37|nr:glycoside hydrolase [Penicillium lagena]KAJ5620231.1 glycoside hydrolase [Penicillium lagena]